MPPESSAGMCPVNASRPTSSSFIRATRSIASSGRSVYTSSGSRTFSSSVIDPNSAPDWYMTPNRRWMRSSVDSSAVTMSSPSMKTWPAIGGLSPIMCFISVLLPQPEPPRMPNTSPRRTSKLMRSWIATPS